MAAANAQFKTCCAGKGSLSYLQWNDQTCNKCGGNVNKLCVQATTGTDKQHSCASEAWALLLRVQVCAVWECCSKQGGSLHFWATFVCVSLPF